MDFGAVTGGGRGAAGGNREEIMEQVKQQIALVNAQELLTKMTQKCFTKCVTRPGSSLDSGEQKCVAMCMDRYMDAWNVVSRAYGNRLSQERSRMS